MIGVIQAIGLVLVIGIIAVTVFALYMVWALDKPDGMTPAKRAQLQHAERAAEERAQYKQRKAAIRQAYESASRYGS